MTSKQVPRDGIETGIASILVELVNHLDAMLAFWNTEQVCVYANSAYHKWFGKTREQVIGMTMKELLGPIYPKNLQYIKAALAGKIQVFEREIPTPEDGVRYSLATYTPYIVEGKVLGFFAHVADVTPLKKLEQELREAKNKAEHLATHDFLTGLPNRVLLIDRLTQAMLRTKRTKQLLAVMSIDMDDFKLINDTYGHDVGDKFLIEIAERLKSTLREYDSVTRIGGDEFLLLMSDFMSSTQIDTMASRILKKINEPLSYAENVIMPTCSIGIACYPATETEPETLISQSDKALYKAKSLGKNRYAFAHI